MQRAWPLPGSEFLAEIELETDRLAQFVDSLLTPWSVAEPWLASGASHESISAGEHVAFTDPASVLDGALHRIRCLLGGRKVRRKVPAGLSAVRMDASQMERALANLLQNAIKYSPPGTPIGISARITASNELEFTIDDEGPGIPAEDRERIFEQPLLVMHPLPHGARSIDLQPLDDLITACGQLVPRCSVLARRAKLRTDACHECRPTLWGRTTAWTESSFAGRTPVAIRTPSVDPGTSVGLCEQALDKPSHERNAYLRRRRRLSSRLYAFTRHQHPQLAATCRRVRQTRSANRHGERIRSTCGRGARLEALWDAISHVSSKVGSLGAFSAWQVVRRLSIFSRAPSWA